MRDSLLAVAIFATIAISTAVDEECIKRKIRGLPAHWPNPTDCSSFYRCTNKNIKRELLCPEGKEYNPKTGRCANKGMGLCRLSLAAPLAESVESSCVGKFSGTLMSDSSSCRNFYLCDNNTAYPQNCAKGSYFNTELLVCEPDTKPVCWENLCIKKANGSFVANDKDCRSFYLCDNETPLPQNCDKKSYFNTEKLYCQPGDCPSNETTTTTATTTEATSSTNTKTSTPETTTTYSTESITTSIPETSTKACSGTTTTTTCAPKTTSTTCVPITPKNTTCTPPTAKTTTARTTKTSTTTATKKTTTTRTQKTTTTTTCTTTTCRPETTTTTSKPKTTTTTTCTITTTTTCRPETTTTTIKPKTTTTTTCTTTTPFTTTTTTCTTAKTTTTTCTPIITTTSTCEPTTTTTCSTTTCPPETTTIKPKTTTTTTCTTRTTTTCPPETTSRTSKPKTTTTTTTWTTKTTTCTTPIITTTTCTPKITTTTTCEPTTTTTCTTAKTTICPSKTTTTACATTNDKCDSSKCRNAKNGVLFPARNSTAGFCVCLNQKPEYHACADDAIYNPTLQICVPQNKVCPSSECIEKANYNTFTASNTTTGFCRCLNGQATFFECAGDGFRYNETLGFCVKCQTTEDALCDISQCQNVKDDFVFPARSTTAGFCVCLNNKAEYRDCPDEASFNVNLRICAAQNKVCPSSKCDNLPHYSTFRATNTSSGFCRCLSGQASFFKCAGTNYVYDNSLGYCVAFNQTSNCTESTQLCNGVYKDGDFVSNPDNCMLFYICYKGDLEEVDCDSGNYFDDQIKACLPDTDYKCPACHQAQTIQNNRRHKRSIRAATCPEGAKTPTADCDKYYKCSKGHKLLYGCGKDNFFNITTLACQLDVQNICWPVNSCTEGDRNPYPEDNTKYYECLHGKQVIMSCDSQSIFNKLTKSCVVRKECTCPGGYKQGDISPHPTDCDKFYICSEGEQVLHKCGADNYFNKNTKICQKDVKHMCHVKEACLCPGGYEEGDRSPHPTDCDKYYICEDGKQIIQKCGQDNYFNETTLSCKADVDNECWPKKVCTCPGGYQEGDMSSHPTDCSKYYICKDSKQVVEECGTNNRFNNNTLTCDLDVYNVCWPNLCAGQVNGALVANPQQCNSFFLCENDEAIPKACLEGQRFDQSAGACIADLKAVCYNPCANETAGPVVLLPHPICNEYYFCNGHKTFVGTCLVGSFDIETGVCNENKKCFPNPCDNPKVTVFPDPYDATKFYWCNPQKQPIPYDCPDGMEFDTAMEVCKKYSDPDCPVCSEDGTYATLDDTNDSEFCVCNNGLATKIECSQNYTFNSDLGVCYSNAPCDPSFCLDAKEYDTTMNRNDTKSFCMCFNKKPIIIDCPNNGSFNPYTLECSDYEISPECLQSTCVGKTNNNHIFAPINTKKNNGFCQCINQIATFKPCRYGSTFNPDLLICQLEEINCNSYQCRGLPNNTFIPSVTTTEGYCECSDGIAIFYNCPNDGEFNATTSKCEAPLCDLSQCTGTKANSYPFAASRPDGFCMCSLGFVPCETEGTLFSADFGICVDPCPQTSCNGKPDKYLVSSALNKYSFCVCHTYPMASATYELCPSESFVFQEAEQLCAPNSQKLCGAAPCKIRGAYEAIDTLSGFCLCTSTGQMPVFEKCERGVFVPETSACMPTAEDVCDVSLCAQATIDHPITLPANNSIAEFCYCSSPTNIMLLPCPQGKYYNQAKAMCVSQQEENCKCPNNIVERGKVADNSSCNKYFECIKGVMHARTCPTGDYFNVKLNDCAADTTGVCAKQSTCTCLGIYYENELLPHPVNPHMYYACQGNTLHEYKCEVGHMFSATQKQCILNAASRQKRSADINSNHEFSCLENDKRSIPANCSQYEICQQNMWQIKTCPNFYYYNPERKQCLEPRDDFVCSYAKVTSLPACNSSMELYLLKAKTCQHYYQCENKKWRLKSCERKQYFDTKIATCLTIPDEVSFKCDKVANTSHMEVKGHCQHLSQRFYEKNCAMYLICLDNEWWYQYCPTNMYYNRSLNFCVRDDHHQCKDVLRTEVKLESEELSWDPCQQDGLLRPSALACNRYFVCLNGKWLKQHCFLGEFYDVANAKCSIDSARICAQLNKDCLTNERKSVPANCSIFEQCSQEGKWLMKTCPEDEIYDDLLQQCTRNSGICSKHGLKRTCRENEFMSVKQNCSMFMYCYQDTWNLGSCLKGFMYSEEKKTCVAHMPQNECKPFYVKEFTLSELKFDPEKYPCQNKSDGSWVPHVTDCSRYYICIQKAIYKEIQCPRGSYYEANLGYCRPNDGSCRLPLTGLCANVSDESFVAHPSECQAFYTCSSINGTELQYCPTGQYFDQQLTQCVIDNGECKKGKVPKQKCADLQHGTRLAHEAYCNIYYSCVKGVGIPVECPDNHLFDNVLGKCIFDKDHRCQDGHLKEENITQDCSNLTDGTFLPHLTDCTRYYVCSQGKTLAKKCTNASYFDNVELLCKPDDGSCPFVSQEPDKNQTAPPDATECDGKHGYLMADPLNCNNFYVCIHKKLKHERCYAQHFFNSTLQQCQQKPVLASLTNNNATLKNNSSVSYAKGKSFQCLDEIFSPKKLCSEMKEGSSLAEPGDCRRFITCQEPEEEPLLQRCRNGESFDSLLGFCRQNDGTCLLENGQRVGECSGKHGQLTRDSKSCRNYFVCINGQKISQICAEGKYFSKSQNMCIKDTKHVCQPNHSTEEYFTQSCDGLSENILYPYIQDNCRSYFQCIKGVAEIHKCADDLYFDPIAIKCIKTKPECVMPTQTLQRSPAFNQTFNKLCSNKKFNVPYANIANDCRSFYLCHENATVSHELCPLGMMFSQENGICVNENKINCMTN